MDNKKIICIKCGKMSSRYLKGLDYCQICYRKALDEYSYYDYKKPKEQITGTALKICEMLIENGVDKQEIHKILGLNKIYVQQIINRYTIHTNSKGEKRPF